jgi:hypothetical protein
MGNMAFAREGQLMLLVHNKINPSVAEWTEYVGVVAKLQYSEDPVDGLLVVSEAGGPNAKQRNEIVGAFEPHIVMTAVCSDSAFARGITTAISWFHPKQLISFRYDEIAPALAGLSVSLDRFDAVVASLHDLQRSIGARLVEPLAPTATPGDRVKR